MIEQFLISLRVPPNFATVIAILLKMAMLVAGSFLTAMAARKYLVKFATILARRSANKWDDALIEHRFFRHLAHMVPAFLIYILTPLFLADSPHAAQLLMRLASIYMIAAALVALNAMVKATNCIFKNHPVWNKYPISGYLQAFEIIVFFIGGIFVLSITLNKSPLGLLSLLGGLTAVLILVFKDVLLGFVASIQLSINDMVAVGDWIEMPKYGADGDIIDISLATVKVRNWDKTITTIPTYALISDSFKNWRGMQESGGRRIKRALYIDMNTIKFCDDAMIERFRKFQHLRKYLDSKIKEIDDYNKKFDFDTSVLINGRRLTNVGTFRAYIVEYLKRHPKIRQDMTFLIRHLAPTPAGLPIEIYVFSNDQVWANYEAIQADIFDHILAVVPEFELRIFQNPSGADFSRLVFGK